MALVEKWVDPDVEVSGSGNSPEDPYKSLEDTRFPGNGNDFICHIKRGTVQTLTQRAQWQNQASVRCEPYGVGPDPVVQYYFTSNDPADWTDQGSGVWRMVTGAERPVVLGVGSLTNATIRRDVLGGAHTPGQGDEAYANPGEWDSAFFGAIGTRFIDIYSPNGNPVTELGPIYWGDLFDAAIQVYNNTNAGWVNDSLLIHGIKFQYCARGIWVQCAIDADAELYAEGGCVIEDSTFEHCFNGVYVEAATVMRGVTVRRNLLENIRGNGMRVSDKSYNALVYENVGRHIGLSESIAFVYIGNQDPGNTGLEPKVFRNWCEDLYSCRWWQRDGYAYYNEHGASGATGGGAFFFDNVAIRCGLQTGTVGPYGGALKLNVGAAGRQVHARNIAIDCNIGLSFSDANDTGNGTAEILGNVLLNCQWQGMRVRCDNDNDITVLNNIVSADPNSPYVGQTLTDGTGTVGLHVAASATDANFSENHNTIRGFEQAYENVGPGSNITAGASTVTGPLADSAQDTFNSSLENRNPVVRPLAESDGSGTWFAPWSGFDNIDWDLLGPGDTLVLEGEFDAELSIPVSGAEGSPVVVTGGVVDGGGTRTHGIDVDDDETDLVLRGIRVQDCRRRGVELTSTDVDNVRRVVLEDMVVDTVEDTSGLQLGLSLNGTEILVRNTSVMNTGDDNTNSVQLAKQITYEGFYGDNPGTYTAGGNGDNIQVPTGAGDLALVRASTLINKADRKQCVIFNLSGASGRGEVSDTYMEMVDKSGNGGACAYIDGEATLLRNRCQGGRYGAHVADGGGTAGDSRVIGNVCSQQNNAGLWAGATAHDAVLAQNTVYDTDVDGGWCNNNVDTVVFRNNIISVTGDNGLRLAGNNVESHNCCHAATDHPVATSAGDARTPGTGTITDDPLLINPAANDFRLQGDSPCIRAGTRWWTTGSQPNDHNGKRYQVAPQGVDMGAYAVSHDAGYAWSLNALPVGVLEAGVDIAKAVPV